MCICLSPYECIFSSNQSLGCVWLFVTPRTVACQSSLSITNSRSLLKLMSIASMMSSNHLILCCPLLLLLLIFPSIRVFSNESVLCIRWPKDWSFNFFPMNIQDWFTLGWTGWISLQSKRLSSLLQHQSSKASILQRSAFFYGPTLTSIHDYWKTIALTRLTFVGKVMSLLVNMLSRLVIDFLPRSKHLLISWLQSPSAVILEPKKIRCCPCFHCFPIYLPWSDGNRCHDHSECWVLSQLFHSPLSLSSRGSLVPLPFLP